MGVRVPLLAPASTHMDLRDTGELPPKGRHRVAGVSGRSRLVGYWACFAAGFYLGVALLAVGIAWAVGRPSAVVAPIRGFDARELWFRGLGGIALAAVFAALVAAWSQWAPLRFRLMARFVAALREQIPPMDNRSVWVVAGASGLGEELLFRGSLLALMGPVWSTILFALLHLPLERRLVPWPIFALVVGAFLAGLTVLSGSVLPAVAAHVLLNGWNLGWLVRGNDGTRATDFRGGAV